MIYADGSINTTSYYKWGSNGNGNAEADKVTATDGEGRTSTAYYDKAGRVVTQEAGGVTMKYEYDNIGNMVKQTQVGSREGLLTIADRVATTKYNALGQMTSQTVQVGSSPNAANDITTSYTYDKVGNRTGMTTPILNVSGNVTGMQSYSYTYNSLDQLTSVTNTTTNRQVSSYTYDDRGNQTKEVSEKYAITNSGGAVVRIDNEETTHTYDLMNQLTSSRVVTPVIDENTQNKDRLADQVNTNYNSYNAAGKRVRRVEAINGVEENSRFYYMGDVVLFTVSEATSNSAYYLQTENILDLSGTTIMSFRFLWPYQAQGNQYANQWYTYRYDVRGSVTNITNHQGAVVDGYEYNEFGITKQVADNGFKNDFTFTNSVKDTSTGLQYMNARFYEPQTGRFLSQDTYSGNAYDPWTQHLYSYCANNPVNFVDPTGHSMVDIGGTGIYVTPEVFQTLKAIRTG